MKCGRHGDFSTSGRASVKESSWCLWKVRAGVHTHFWVIADLWGALTKWILKSGSIVKIELYGSWEALVGCKLLLQGVGRISTPELSNSENSIFCDCWSLCTQKIPNRTIQLSVASKGSSEPGPCCIYHYMLLTDFLGTTPSGVTGPPHLIPNRDLIPAMRQPQPSAASLAAIVLTPTQNTC